MVYPLHPNSSSPTTLSLQLCLHLLLFIVLFNASKNHQRTYGTTRFKFGLNNVKLRRSVDLFIRFHPSSSEEQVYLSIHFFFFNLSSPIKSHYSSFHQCIICINTLLCAVTGGGALQGTHRTLQQL